MESKQKYDDLIEALRCDGKCNKPNCPYAMDDRDWCDEDRIIHDAADALEAAEKRIAELEKQAEHTDQVDAMNFAMHLKQVARIAELEAQIPKRGEWMVCGIFDDFLKCSICGRSTPWTTYEEYHYCPNCGADMRGAK